MIIADSYSVILHAGAESIPLSHKGGPLTLDDSWAPRVRGSIEVAIPAADTLALLDTREQLRLTVECSASYSTGTPTARTFDLAVRGRDIDHEAGTVAIAVASDEALMMDDVWLDDEPNLAPLDHQDSLRDLIDSVLLSRIGAELEPGTADAPFRVLWNATNNVANGFLRSAASGWRFSNGTLGAAARVAVTDPPEPGIGWCASVTGLSAGTDRGMFYQAGIVGTDGVPVSAVNAGDLYHARAWIKTNAAVPVSLRVEWGNSAGATIGSASGPEVTTTANVWTLVKIAAIAPTGAARVGHYCYTRVGYSAPGGLSFQMCGLTGTAGEFEPDECWDGTTTDTLEYAYQWAGATSASNSTRTALIDRAPDLLDWEPGDSAWTFVQPLVEAAGLRLFCDEQRRWFLVDPSYIAPGVLQLSVPYNLHSAVDRMNRDDPEWFDAAILIYRWLDYMAIRQERIDYYAEPGYTKVRTFVIERPYPGPGAAEYYVSRAIGRGRTMNGLVALARFNVEPVQPLTVNLPDTPIQTGAVAAVTFDTSTGRMSVDSRGLTDTPPDAVIFLPGTVASLTGTVANLLA